jgi:hypothetical protein
MDRERCRDVMLVLIFGTMLAATVVATTILFDI